MYLTEEEALKKAQSIEDDTVRERMIRFVKYYGSMVGDEYETTLRGIKRTFRKEENYG